MKFFLKKTSLQQIAEVKIVSELWNHDDIKTEIEKINLQSLYSIEIHPDCFLKNQSLENNIMEKVSALPIPNLLKENLLILVRLIGSQIKQWWCYHKDLALKMPDKLCWTPHGTVDYKKTAELIVQDDSVSIETRYRMACTYCFENEITILWKRIPKKRKKPFYYFKWGFPTIVPWDEPVGGDYRKHSVAFWTYNVSNRVTELNQHMLEEYDLGFDISSHEIAFKWATFALNRTAAAFFFEKLSCEEKDKYHIGYTCNLYANPSITHSCKMETMLFLLNQMSEEQQEIVFKLKAFNVLLNMLHWPYQTLFLQTAKKFSHYLSIYEYSRLFNKMCDKIKRGKKDYGYRELLGEFWLLGSANYHAFYQNDSIISNIMELL